jgi:hypothetical protein
MNVPESVRLWFVAAGWHLDRHIPVPPTVPTNHPAADILAAFGGLTVSRSEDAEGEQCGIDDLAFAPLFPDSSITETWAGLLRTRLVGIANIHYGHGEWYVASDGRVFGRSCIHDAFWFSGDSFAEAAERSLLGRRVRPMLRPDQRVIDLYGNRIAIDNPTVYRYL